ncbi:hydrogenase maturation factor [Sulfolobus sp. SCGC AB-777_L09]|jgi:hydrogenase expression/formation protein HypC|nr:hydrogenase maturation factor [Sulfolobus sp. SCGC AB-777_L09]
MCISLPAKVVQVEGMIAFVDYGDNNIQPVIVSVDDVKEGDYVVVSYGMIIEKIDEKEFKEMLEYEMQLRQLISSSSSQ